MAIPELAAKRAEKLLTQFCQERVPPHARHQAQLLYRKRGNAMTLYERRPVLMDATQHTEMPIAKFQYDAESKAWTLYWQDRNGRWHIYEECIDQLDISMLLEEVDADPTGIFWG